METYLWQFANDLVRIGGIQETRRPSSGICVENGYILAEASCESNGSGGVLLAVSCSLAFAPADALCRLPRTVALTDVNILVAHSRMLIVKFFSPRLSLLCAVVQGLDSSYPPEQVELFWDTSHTTIRSVRVVDEPLLLCVDGNCRPCVRDGCDDVVIGDMLDALPSETFVSPLVTKFVTRCDAMIASTLSSAVLDYPLPPSSLVKEGYPSGATTWLPADLSVLWPTLCGHGPAFA